MTVFLMERMLWIKTALLLAIKENSNLTTTCRLIICFLFDNNNVEILCWLLRSFKNEMEKNHETFFHRNINFFGVMVNNGAKLYEV